ncbi:hypothetical protein NUBL21983_06700 [Klebsiella variicola]|nr:hypothetical protein NUBL21983_06700 [Klebsiella variicola]GKQ00708.1 hypothetical protein NUKP74_44100 [Klebsiella quasipneumoniae]
MFINLMDFYLFRTLNEAREITERWLAEYNSERPHESLNNLTPEEYRLMAETSGILKKCVELKRVRLHLPRRKLGVS